MLTELLAERRTSILKRWLGLIFESYAPQTARFLGAERDRFANPVGQTIAREIEVAYDGIRSTAEVESFSPALEAIVKIRAVQDFRASDAVAFIFQLKRAIREELAGELDGAGLAAPLRALDARIDAVAARCFDLYMSAREKIYEIKANELRKRTHFLLERATRLPRGAKPGDDDDNHEA